MEAEFAFLFVSRKDVKQTSVRIGHGENATKNCTKCKQVIRPNGWCRPHPSSPLQYLRDTTNSILSGLGGPFDKHQTCALVVLQPRYARAAPTPLRGIPAQGAKHISHVPSERKLGTIGHCAAQQSARRLDKVLMQSENRRKSSRMFSGAPGRSVENYTKAACIIFGIFAGENIGSQD